jgi:hypothetical protein
VSAARDEAHLFSFRLRVAAGSLPTLVKVLIGPRYEVAGWLEPGAVKVGLLEEQAHPSFPDVRKVHKLFNQFLLAGLMPSDIDLVPAVEFERQRFFTFQANEPELYAHLRDSGSKLATDCLNRIRNYAEITEGQRRLALQEMEVVRKRKEFTDARQRRAARTAQARRDEDAIPDEGVSEAEAALREEMRQKLLKMRDQISDDPA